MRQSCRSGSERGSFSRGPECEGSLLSGLESWGGAVHCRWTGKWAESSGEGGKGSFVLKHNLLPFILSKIFGFHAKNSGLSKFCQKVGANTTDMSQVTDHYTYNQHYQLCCPS